MTILTWIDLETTGLKPSGGHRILEYAVVFTDLELNEIASCEGVIPQYENEARALMDDYVTKMHTDNGLLDAIKCAQVGNIKAHNAISYGCEVQLAEERILNMMDGDKSVIFVIAGSNILFDVKWIMEQMPGVARRLDHKNVIEGPESYRCLDVSSYKVGFPDIFKTATSAKHRAMDDIRASIAMHAKMRSMVEDAWKYETLE